MVFRGRVICIHYYTFNHRRMKTRFELNIIQPQITECSENWDNMLPHEKGAFCNSCNKVVHDLSKLNGDQLAAFLIKNEEQSVCGKVNAGLLNKPVSLIYKRPEKYSYNFLFTITLFIVFGTTLFSCDEKEHDIIKTNIENTFFENINITRETNSPELEYNVSSSCECVNEEAPIIDVIDRDSSAIDLNEIVITSKTMGKLGCYRSGGMGYTIKTIYHEIDTTPITPLLLEAPVELPLLVYPNPARDHINIKYTIAEEGLTLLTFFNINGQKIADIFNSNESTPGIYTKQFDVSELPSGMYILILLNNDHKEVFRVSVTH